MDIAATDHLLSTTRAVRKRLDLDRPVGREVILECLRLAQQAPTGGNQQGWRWLVVTDPDKRQALADIYNANRAIIEGARDVAHKNGDPQTIRVYDSAVNFGDVLHRVPVHVIPCIKGRADNAPNVSAASLYGSILPAVWSFMLAARSRGLGTVWTTIHLVKEAEAAKLLGIPDGWTQAALIPVAYTTGGDFKPAARPPVETVTFWDGWDQPA